MKRIRRAGLSDRVGAALLSLCLAELVLVAVTLWTVFDYLDAVSTRGESRELLLALDGTLIGLVDAESSERAYFITGDESFLAPYRAGVASADASLAEVERNVGVLGKSGRRELQDLRPAVVAREEQLAAAIALRDSPGSDLAARAISENRRAGVDGRRARTHRWRARSGRCRRI